MWTIGATSSLNTPDHMYRVRAAARCSECSAFQDSWITRGQPGARVRHGNVDALPRINCDVELAMLSDNSVYGAAMDLSGAFVNIPQAITLEIFLNARERNEEC